jgi:hypothetical protein
MIHQPCPYISCSSSDAFEHLVYNPLSGIFYRTDLKRESGSLNKLGYLTLSYKGKVYLTHRLAFFIMTGRWPIEIDHINRVRSDNRWENLREVTPTQQATNKCGWGSTGKKGVYWHKSREKYHVRVRYKNKVHHVGYFDDLEEAKDNYDRVAKELHGDYFNA